MTTTRKDLYRIADAFAQSKPREHLEAAHAQWLKDVSAVADALNVTTGFTPSGNRSFDWERFFEACGVPR